MADSEAKPMDSIQFAIAFGEMRGQVKELVHAMNAKADRDAKFADAITKLEQLPSDISDIKTRISGVEARLVTMETANTTREAERSLLYMLLKSPALGWIVGALTLIGLEVTNRLNL